MRPRDGSRGRPGWPAVLFGLLLVATAGLRLIGIDHPDRIMFDEHHYVPDAREYLQQGVEVDRPAHPPAAKWVIAGSIALFGDRPIGWRLPAALSGTAVVAVTYLMGRRLFPSPWAALLAAFLVAVDGLALTMSRIGMLDGIQAGFVAVGALFILYDWQSPHRRWRYGVGAVLGIAIACKWSSGLVLVVAVGVALVGELGGSNPSSSRSLRAWSANAAHVVVPLVVVPVLVYVASYASWFANVDRSETGRERCVSSCTFSETVSGWRFEQWDMYDLQRRLKTTHPDRSRPAAWLTLGHPVLTYADGCPTRPEPATNCRVAPGKRARIVGLGNPALWWPALLAYPYLAWATVRRHRADAGFVLALVTVQVVPWFFTQNPGFAYYLTPVVPFVALALTLSVVDLAKRHRGWLAVPAVIAVAAAGIAVWLLPIWFGLELSPSALDARLLLAGWR